jgi:hypothetical protein
MTEKSRRLERIGHVAMVGDTKKAYGILVGNLLENIHTDTQDVRRLTLHQRCKGKQDVKEERGYS